MGTMINARNTKHITKDEDDGYIKAQHISTVYAQIDDTDDTVCKDSVMKKYIKDTPMDKPELPKRSHEGSHIREVSNGAQNANRKQWVVYILLGILYILALVQFILIGVSISKGNGSAVPTTGKSDDSAKCHHVAFRTHLTKDLGLIQTGTTIVYDRVDLNIGGAYNPFLGVFTAPCSGIYLFAMSIANKNQPGTIHLRKNNITVEYALAGHNIEWDMVGLVSVVRLQTGDSVWVAGKGYIVGTDWFDGIGPALRTGFSGTLLHVI